MIFPPSLLRSFYFKSQFIRNALAGVSPSSRDLQTVHRNGYIDGGIQSVMGIPPTSGNYQLLGQIKTATTRCINLRNTVLNERCQIADVYIVLFCSYKVSRWAMSI